MVRAGSIIGFNSACAAVVMLVCVTPGCSRKGSSQPAEKPSARSDKKKQVKKSELPPPDRRSLSRCRAAENKRGKGISTLGWKGSRRWDNEKKVDLLFVKAQGEANVPLYARPSSEKVVSQLEAELVVRRLEVKVGPGRCWYRIETPDGATGWISNKHVIGQGGWSGRSCGG